MFNGKTQRQCFTTIVCVEKDSFRSWVICAVCFANFLVLGGITGPLFGVMVTYLEDYFIGYAHYSATALTTIGSMQSGTMLLLAPIGGMLLSASQDGYSACIDFKICVIGYFIAAISILVSTFSPTIYSMIIIYGFCSGAGLSILMMQFIVTCDLSFEKKRNIATSVARSGQILGMVIFPSAYNVILSDYGWKFADYVSSGILLFLMVIGLFLIILERLIGQSKFFATNDNDTIIEENQPLLSDHLENPVQPEQERKASLTDDTRRLSHIKQDDDTTKGSTDFGLEENDMSIDTLENIDSPKRSEYNDNTNQDIFKRVTLKLSQQYAFLISNNGAVLCILIAKLFGNGAISIHNNYLPTFLEERGVSSSWASSVVSIENSAGFLSCILCGLLANYGIIIKGAKITPLIISSIAFFCAGIVYLTMIFTYNTTALTLLCVLSGLTKTPFISLSSVLWFGNVALESYTLAVVYALVVQGTGTIIFPPIANLLCKDFDSYTMVIVVECIAALVCGIFFGLGSYISRTFKNK